MRLLQNLLPFLFGREGKSYDLAALWVGTGAPAAFAQCAISPGANQPSVSNSAAINCININGITVTGNVTNTSTGTPTATGSSQPTRTGITINTLRSAEPSSMPVKSSPGHRPVTEVALAQQL